jgi:hypothetical protein
MAPASGQEPIEDQSMSDFNRSDIPPTRTIEPMDPPPPSDRPTSAMLKGDIDSGRTGDKNPVFDPALSPLGTDDEAAGAPPNAFRVALARHYETVQRWMGEARMTGPAHNQRDGFPVLYVSFIAAVGVVLTAGIWMSRAGD